ncbi:hypothetical protein [Mycoplana dimorpha]|uniref:Uncharacterized protein n=1 Tax=Mycoplana dimorpha TaxID=28320 RepID=A0A2T5BID7_MYCDI|nr:hypothetical protein [Mycoplana dimorpha]PTM98761.1 hypothetical protein C7449_101427 [Mycoplana dimorpha]
MFTDGAKRSIAPETNDDGKLVDQYKPLGLKAVLAAASQRRPQTPKTVKPELPAGLKHIEA